MNTKYTHTYLIAAILLLLLFTACTTSETTAPPVDNGETAYAAALTEIEGEVDWSIGSETPWLAAPVGQLLVAGSRIRTGSDSSASIEFSEGTIMRVDERSILTITELSETESNSLVTRLQLVIGQVFVVFNDPVGDGAFEVETPTGVAAVRGSYMSVRLTIGGQLVVSCLEGHCEAQNDSGITSLIEGQQTAIRESDTPPTDPRPMDAYQYNDWFDSESTSVMVSLIEEVVTEDQLSMECDRATSEGCYIVSACDPYTGAGCELPPGCDTSTGEGCESPAGCNPLTGEGCRPPSTCDKSTGEGCELPDGCNTITGEGCRPPVEDDPYDDTPRITPTPTGESSTKPTEDTGDSDTRPTPTPTKEPDTRYTPTPTKDSGTRPTPTPTSDASTRPSPTPTSDASTRPSPTPTVGKATPTPTVVRVTPTPTSDSSTRATPTPTTDTRPQPTATTEVKPTATTDIKPTATTNPDQQPTATKDSGQQPTATATKSSGQEPTATPTK